MHTHARKVVAVLGMLALPLTGAAKGCASSDGGGPARSASYAGDGITQFGSQAEGVSGKLQWGKTYSAHYVDTTDRQTCKWNIMVVDHETKEATVIARGNYFSAKVRVGRQVTKDVFLKSVGCGLWKPATSKKGR